MVDSRPEAADKLEYLKGMRKRERTDWEFGTLCEKRLKELNYENRQPGLQGKEKANC